MHRFAASLFVVVALFASVSCGGGDSHEKAAKDMLGVIGEFTAVLADIKDTESAEANKSRLEDLTERMRDLDTRMKALGESTEEQKDALTKMDGADEVQGKFIAEMMRLGGQPEVFAVLQSTLEGMQGIGK